MMSSLPDRPLSPAETVNTSHSKSDFLMLPAIPDSMFEGEELTDVRDLLIITEEVIAVLVYEGDAGWETLVRFEDRSQVGQAVRELIDHRHYDTSQDDIETIVREYEELITHEFGTESH